MEKGNAVCADRFPAPIPSPYARYFETTPITHPYRRCPVVAYGRRGAGGTLAGVMHPFHLVKLQAAAAGVHGPAATSGFTLADVVGLVAALIIPVGIVALAFFLSRPPDSRDDGDSDSGWGRGGPGRPPWPDDGPLKPGGDPVWWPEFERLFAQYVGERPRSLRSVDVSPARFL